MEMRFIIVRLLVLVALSGLFYNGTGTAGAAVSDSKKAVDPPAHGIKITSITPNPARRSERVMVSGHGFGAANVRVRLGGQPVIPDAARGAGFEFTVPEYGLVGDLLLEVINPGGIVASATLSVPFDGRVLPVVDRTRTVTQNIGPAGGVLTVGEITLTIPPGALLDPVDISMSPLTDLAGSPIAPIYDAVQLEPSSRSRSRS
ncbi:MAG: hypothetical protein RDV41_12480 [Planctomycetota bacterium]|nr:hypothetical protein [Planctomycetota bacterium]